MGAPPSEATRAYSPLCSTRIKAILRSLPDLAPSVVSRITGMSAMVMPSVVPLSMILATCFCDQSSPLGSYSPVNGMTTTVSPGRNVMPRI
ncbi:Uncharacterised protein [Mycobacteroides abscessus subsp. abscessus]|nr:Uncharacterised protein [Mycobacteroides abscessus subsp. abscessus]